MMNEETAVSLPSGSFLLYLLQALRTVYVDSRGPRPLVSLSQVPSLFSLFDIPFFIALLIVAFPMSLPCSKMITDPSFPIL